MRIYISVLSYIHNRAYETDGVVRNARASKCAFFSNQVWRHVFLYLWVAMALNVCTQKKIITNPFSLFQVGVRICLSVSVSFYVVVYLTVMSLPLYICLCLQISVYVSLYVFVHIPFYPSFFICVSFYLYISVCLCLCLSVCLSLSLFISLSLSICLFACVSIYLAACRFHLLFLFLCLSLSACVASVCMGAIRVIMCN